MAAYGYQLHKDVELTIRGCSGLPRTDLVGHCDPYVVLNVLSPDGRQRLLQYKTAVVYNTATPVFDEEVYMMNVPYGALFAFEVYDKDHLTRDDAVGSCSLRLDDAVGHGGPVGGVQLVIQGARGVAAVAGTLQLEVRHRPSCAPPGPVLHCGPVRYRVSVSTLAGALTGHTDGDGWLAYAAYKLILAGVQYFFPEGAGIHWNTSYDKAQQIFKSPVMATAVRTQHSMLYADDGSKRSRGVLRGGGDLVSLLRGGVRAGQRRYYTYAITADGAMCFSETGAAFFSDFMSKHAMHAGCAETVVYAGEFCLVPPGLPPAPPPAAAGSPAMDASPSVVAGDAALASAAAAGARGDSAPGWTLVADNNSGTYAPPGARLPALAALLQHNMRGLRIEVLDSRDPRLRELHSRVPSRVRA